ncbi:GL22488 [Drosophila persimilis]|nr:GL22488 [Drosophila persimilis]
MLLKQQRAPRRVKKNQEHIRDAAVIKPPAAIVFLVAQSSAKQRQNSPPSAVLFAPTLSRIPLPAASGSTVYQIIGFSGC